MLFASPLFLFVFLPLVLGAYFVAPPRLRNWVLLVASVAFYAWGEGLYVAVVLASIAFNWFSGMRIGRASPRIARGWLVFGIAGNVILLAIFKYANFAIENVNALRAATSLVPVAWAHVLLPLGISFFTFHALSYLIDVHRGNAEPQRNLGTFALYILLFPQLIAGPIIRYKDIVAQLAHRDRRVNDLAVGIRRFIVGLGKKVLIANTLGEVADSVFSIAPGELDAGNAWLGLICYTLQIYFDFSGYSDMAIGLMRMFGFRILENFNYPYISQSIREFWRRWHISLSNWFRDYVYVPLGGNRCGRVRSYVNLVIVFLLCGLWHGANWTFVCWGVWHGSFLVLERAGLARALNGAIKPLRHVYALAVVMMGWILFRSESLAHAASYYAALAGFGAPSGPLHPLPMLLDQLILTTLVVAIVAATPVGRHLAEFGDGKDSRIASVNQLVRTSELVVLGAVLVLSAAALAAGTYNPFIYFRF